MTSQKNGRDSRETLYFEIGAYGDKILIGYFLIKEEDIEL